MFRREDHYQEQQIRHLLHPRKVKLLGYNLGYTVSFGGRVAPLAQTSLTAASAESLLRQLGRTFTQFKLLVHFHTSPLPDRSLPPFYSFGCHLQGSPTSSTTHSAPLEGPPPSGSSPEWLSWTPSSLLCFRVRLLRHVLPLAPPTSSPFERCPGSPLSEASAVFHTCLASFFPWHHHLLTCPAPSSIVV